MEDRTTVITHHTGLYPSKKRTPKGEELHVYDCPFPTCGKEQHLHFFPETTTWDCKVCGRKGNNYVFIQMLYNDVCTGKIDAFASFLDLPKRVFKDVKFNPLNRSFVLPSFKNGKMNNLYKYSIPDNGRKAKFYGSPGIQSSLSPWSDEWYQEVWVCEGQKDWLAARAIIGELREITPVYLPGATTFKQNMCIPFEGKDIVLFFDNDDAGENGLSKTLSVFRDSPIKPRTISKLVWDDADPKGYDLYDLYQEYKGSSYTVTTQLTEEVNDSDLIKVQTETIQEDYSCNSYDLAVESFSKAYHLTSDIEAALALTMASIFSINVPGEQVWIKILGPPGSGKTSIVDSVSASEHVYTLSTFKGLFSGWMEGSGRDAGLIPKIVNKSLIVKDADALLKQPNVDQIMSELRDFYDRHSAVRYRTGQEFRYDNTSATFILCGTNVLRGADQSFLGERMLTIELEMSQDDHDKVLDLVINRQVQLGLGKIKDPKEDIKGSMKGWLNHLRERKPDTELSKEYLDELKHLSYAAACLRTILDRDFKGQLKSPPTIEKEFRLIGQAISASISLGAVYGENKPTEAIYRVIKKVMKDTANPKSRRFKLCDVILDREWTTVEDLTEATGLSEKIVKSELGDLLELDLLKTKHISSPITGYKRIAFQLKGPFHTGVRSMLI